MFAKSKVEWIKTSLNNKRAGVICLLLAFFNKVSIAWLYTDLEGDKSLYLLFSDSALKGKPFLEPVSFYNGSNTEYIFNPAANSPLYSIISAPVLWLTGSFAATSIIMDAMAWGIFITGLYTVAQSVFRERWIANVFILCAGFFLYPHELASTPKDTLAIGLLLWGACLTYRIIRSNALHLPLVLLASLLFVLLALTKFLYAPLTLLFVVVLFAHAIRTKNKAQWYGAFFSFSIVAICILLYSFFTAYQKSLAAPLKINPDGTTFTLGFFPGNLCYTYPFITSSVINTNFWGVQLERIFRIPFSNATKGFRLIDLFAWGGGVLLLVRYYKQIRKVPLTLLVLAVFSVAIIFMVGYVSLTQKANVNRLSGGGYTYVMEARSFLFPMLTIQLLVFYGIFKTAVSPVLKALFLFLFVFECLHGFYFTGKQLINRDRVLAYQQVNSPARKVVSRLASLKKDHPDLGLVTTENHLRRLALVNGLNAFSLPYVCDTPVTVKAPTVVVVPLRDSMALKTCLTGSQPSFSDTIPPLTLRFFHFD